MYYPVGWPRLLSLPQESGTEPVRVCANRDRILVSILTQDSILIWYAKPCVPIISHRRSPQSVLELGTNLLVCWRPDSSMIAVATSGGHIIFYNLVVLTDLKSLYEQEDPTNQALKRESAELFFKENVPPLVFSQAFEVPIPGGITDMASIRDELMISTQDGHILRYLWDGQVNRDYCLDLRRIPFCMDQQVLRAVPLVEEAHVTSLSYSPLLGGFAIVLSDGRAAFLVANTLKFDPNGVQGIWAGGVEDVTCTALNHKYRLIAFGRENSQGAVYSIDESTGGLELSHHLILPTKDYPGCPGPVTAMKWTPDSTSLVLVWGAGGFSIWSTFGTMIMCSLGWDYGDKITDPIRKSPYNIQDLDWSAEGYQLWVVNNSTRQFTGKKDAEFCPFPSDTEGGQEKPDFTSHLGNNVLVIPFVKSPLTVNPAMSANAQLYLQGEDRIYMNTGDTGVSQKKEAMDKIESIIKNNVCEGDKMPDFNPPASNMQSSHTKQWTIVSIPHTYISSSWPIRYTACDTTGQWLAVAGRTGLAYYSEHNKKWKLFGNETQEKDFIVTGGVLWWKDFLVIGCFNISANRDEVRLYPREARLENTYCTTEEVDAQVLLLNRLGDRLVVYCANSHISLYQLERDESNPMLANMTKVQDVDASALSIHPACVVSITLTHLRTEARQRSGEGRDSADRSFSADDSASLIMNVSGRLVLIQRERGSGDEMLYSPPTVLAGSCEQVWLPATANRDKPHLTLALWLYCGAAGMRVWLPLFPREGESSHAFMARRIMLHFPLNNIYPLAILFEDALMLGVENHTQGFPESSFTSPSSLPFSTVERVAEVYLQQLLRQLIRRNLGQHAWEIASSCSKLPYFQHSLELLLHSVLEEEATSKEPIPDALLPSVVDFIRSFPVYRETVVMCTRKTEVALWPYMFAAVGSPKDLFSECLERQELHVAASYLLVLQSLESATVSRQHATQLLDAALDSGDWKLAKDLIRFLRAIDPDECEELASPRISQILPPFSSPLSPPHAEVEDLSLVLGTLVGPRTRSISINQQPPKTGSPPDPQNHQALSRSASEKGPKLKRMSNSSSHNNSRDASTAEEFFIDVILARHARKLLTAGRMADLGTFQANLEYPLVTWLRREQNRAAQVDDFVWAVKRIHQDFDWPWPSDNGGRSRVNSNNGGKTNNTNLVEDNLRQLYIDTGVPRQHNQMDSGYLSQGGSRPVRHSDLSLLSEHTVDAMLRMRDSNRTLDQRSVLSDDLGSVCGIQSPTLSSPPPLPYTPREADPPRKAKAKLNYMLNLLLEAECLEWASCFAIILQDVMAIIRIVNAARSAPDSSNVVDRLHQGFTQLTRFASTNSTGYSIFFDTIQPQITSLASLSMDSGREEQAGQEVEGYRMTTSTPRSLSRSVSDPGEKVEVDRATLPRARTPSPGRDRMEGAESADESGCVVM